MLSFLKLLRKDGDLFFIFLLKFFFLTQVELHRAFTKIAKKINQNEKDAANNQIFMKESQVEYRRWEMIYSQSSFLWHTETIMLVIFFVLISFFFCSVLFCFVSFCFYFNREMIVSTNGGAASDGGTNRNREERWNGYTHDSYTHAHTEERWERIKKARKDLVGLIVNTLIL